MSICLYFLVFASYSHQFYTFHSVHICACTEYECDFGRRCAFWAQPLGSFPAESAVWSVQQNPQSHIQNGYSAQCQRGKACICMFTCFVWFIYALQNFLYQVKLSASRQHYLTYMHLPCRAWKPLCPRLMATTLTRQKSQRGISSTSR